MRRRSVTIPEAGEILGLTRSAAYRAAKAGEIHTISIGSRYLVPVAWLEEILGEVIDLDGEDATQGDRRRLLVAPAADPILGSAEAANHG